MALCTFPFDRCLMGFKLFITPGRSRAEEKVYCTGRSAAVVAAAEGYAKEPLGTYYFTYCLYTFRVYILSLK